MSALEKMVERYGWVRPEGEGARAIPASMHAAVTLVRACCEAGVELSGSGVLPRGGVALDRSHLDEVGPIDEASMWIFAGAGARLSEVEVRLRASGLSLGSQPPSVLRGTVFSWLEGPLAGRRSEAGRIGPGVASIEAVLPDGMVYRSRAAPRSAAGPGVQSLVLGGGGAAGLVLAATLKAQPLASRTSTLSVKGRADAAAALLAEICSGLSPPASAEIVGGSPLCLACTFAGDQAEVMALLVRATARSESLDLSPTPPPGQLVPDAEVEMEIAREAMLPALKALPEGERMRLYRLARESAIAVVSQAAAGSLELVPGAVRLDAPVGDLVGAGPSLELFARIVARLRRPP